MALSRLLAALATKPSNLSRHKLAEVVYNTVISYQQSLIKLHTFELVQKQTNGRVLKADRGDLQNASGCPGERGLLRMRPTSPYLGFGDQWNHHLPNLCRSSQRIRSAPILCAVSQAGWLDRIPARDHGNGRKQETQVVPRELRHSSHSADPQVPNESRTLLQRDGRHSTSDGSCRT